MTDLTFTADEQPKMSAFNERFSILNQLYQYWWKRRQYYEVATWIETQTKYVDGSTYNYIILNLNTASNTVQYSDEISIDQSSGAVSLLNPQSISFSNTDSFSNKQNAPLLVGKYISHVYNNVGALLDGIYFIPAGSQAQVAGYDDNTHQTSFVDVAMTVSSEQIQAGNYGPWEYLRSNDRNAYPDSGKQDGYEYEYLGIPFENAREAPKIATGSYVGTGTYGADNPTVLNFEFVPKIVMITKSDDGIFANYHTIFLWIGQSGTYGTSQYQCSATLVGNSLQLCSGAGALWQANENGSYYLYTALG